MLLCRPDMAGVGDVEVIGVDVDVNVVFFKISWIEHGSLGPGKEASQKIKLFKIWAF